MTTQSNVQGLLEGGVGLQNTAQSGVPSGVNNGNPNTPYNWATYIPSITNGANGQPTNVSFTPLTATVPNMSAYGNQTPFTPDPFMAMLLAQLRAPIRTGLGGVPGYGGGNSMINNILANMLRGPVTPSAGAPTVPGATVPATGGGAVVPNPSTGTATPVVAGPSVGGNNTPSLNPPNVGGSATVGGGVGSIGQSYNSNPINNNSPTYGFNYANSNANGGADYTNFSENPVGSGYDFSTAPLTGSGSSSTGNFFTRLLDGSGLVPANSSPGGFWSDLIASGAQSLGINGTMDPNTPNTFNPAQAAAGLLGGPAGSAAYNAIMGPNTAPSGNNLGGIVTHGPEVGFGIPGMEGANQGNWNIGDTYAAPNYNFSNLSTSLPSGGDPNFDPIAYLDAARAAEGTTTAATTPVATTATTPANTRPGGVGISPEQMALNQQLLNVLQGQTGGANSNLDPMSQGRQYYTVER